MKVLAAQSCLTLYTPVDCSLPDSSNAWNSPGNLPDPGIEPRSPALQADSFPAEPLGKPCIPLVHVFWWSETNPMRKLEAHTYTPLVSSLSLFLPIEKHGPMTITHEPGESLHLQGED